MFLKNQSWRNHIKVGDDWIWVDEKLWHKRAPKISKSSNPTGVAGFFVEKIYADQNQSKTVKNCLAKVLNEIPENGLSINIGAGRTKYENVVNLEINDGMYIHVIVAGVELPFNDCTVDLVISQEVIEHVADYHGLIKEVYRVLKPGGKFFCQAPFQIGFHPGPSDFWRFSRQAFEHLFSAPTWKIEEILITLGHGSGFYRIAVEFIAVTVSCFSQHLYRPTKALSALVLYPLKWFDLMTRFSKEQDRIPGGYLCIARKI